MYGSDYQQYFDYSDEKVDDILCIDMKSFYASVECIERGLDPLKALLVVMSGSDSPGGLALATSPKAKELLGIDNVTRNFQIPYHKDLHIVPPRMNLYIKKNVEINNIFRRYVADEDILIYSIDETFVRVKASKKLFNLSPYQFAERFKHDIQKETRLPCTIGIGDNMLLSKLALDNAAKHAPSMIATWHYQDVPNTVWQIKNMTDFWGINRRTEKRLNNKGIYSIYDLAHHDFFEMKESMGVMGQQLIAHAWGIDRSNISEVYQPKSKSIGNSQVLMKDYVKVNETKIVLREIAEQVATRLRKKGYQTSCVHLSVGYSRSESTPGFSRQMSIPKTNSSKKLASYCLLLFDKFYDGSAVRNLSVNYSKLSDGDILQLNLFEQPEELVSQKILDETIDSIREKYGFDAIYHASSRLEGATAINRSHLVGGHAGGMDGLT
ncbi:Y-family DNA polymerase [Vagococcus carniphilus]|uniref:Y-family DNA polymerase n=1 Tax=Vagococcus carniphilus TaxID=218144 RepID=A0AAW8UB68_9ENTE|nr:Y-family DNA polymerase [Vagococcus carniphilus]MDT2814995.1 Y-family DNA polymerase [Vagococcus carniphilus]MDT2829789.1 Y-family DNA polymerase [Vagococcus carniphilus]MDT2834203.1 Y-family DNA polymerase [Vagococcus carniphilus]MDT2839248.1 Y-family DNA polymerase [Vagococcus carniphilus]MDT2853307.1 Y-family DNA polymerase [Vagococcus carniphilus]